MPSLIHSHSILFYIFVRSKMQVRNKVFSLQTLNLNWHAKHELKLGFLIQFLSKTNKNG